MIVYQTFDIEIRRAVSADGLRWPTGSEVVTDSGLGCNRAYLDLRGFSWKDVTCVYDLESQLIERLETATDSDDEYDTVVDELYDYDDGLFGLDIGVASAVIALSAAGCTPCSSCNAGAYGGTHYERYPVISFYAKAKQIDLLLRCAEEANVGLENDANGIVVVSADDIRNMRTFANALIHRKAEFRTVARNRVTKLAPKSVTSNQSVDETDQLRLPLD